MKKLKRKILAVVTSGLMSLNILGMNTVVNAAENYGEGLISDSETDISGYYDKLQDTAMSVAPVPSKVDLSTSACFPPIGDQGVMGSCVAFATTYYQYTFEVNKLNNVTSVADRVVYSPKWIYNLVNNGYDIGMKPLEAYSTLETLGCIKNDDFKFKVEDSNDYKEWPSGLDNEKIEALQTRVSETNMYEIRNNNQINNVDDEKLNIVKQLLNNGKVLTVSSQNRWDSKTLENGEGIVVRAHKRDEPGGHMLTVVGYDDNMSYDVNRNGKIEDCEKGAFKVANSYGRSFTKNGGFGVESNTGYFWVMYDALNYSSANTINDWQKEYKTTRYPAFGSYSNSANRFYYINVTHKKPNFIGKLTVNTCDRESLNIKINRRTSDLWSNYNATDIFPYVTKGGDTLSYKGSIYFDYDNFASPISKYCNGYYWQVTTSEVAGIDKFSFGIIDSQNRTVKEDKSLTNREDSTSLSGYYVSGYYGISLKKGDINYDGAITESDSDILIEHCLGAYKLSYLQEYIADVDNSGSVNIGDVTYFKKYLLSSSAGVKKIDDFVKAYYSNDLDSFAQIYEMEISYTE